MPTKVGPYRENDPCEVERHLAKLEEEDRKRGFFWTDEYYRFMYHRYTSDCVEL